MSTVTATILGGVSVFVLGQIVLKFFLDPIYEQRKVLGQVANGLIYHAQWHANPGKDDLNGQRSAAADDLRRISCDLLAVSHAVPVYRFWAIIRVIPPWKNVRNAHGQLIFLSNSMFQGDPLRNAQAVDSIKSLLRMRF